MKFIIVNISRFLVGLLFVFSGVIKMNDPVGFSFKLEEYFGEDVLNLPFLQPFALGFAVFIVIYEITLGVTLILGIWKRFTLISLAGMMGFFTFLTFRFFHGFKSVFSFSVLEFGLNWSLKSETSSVLTPT